jgi:hypothetical protein
LTERSQFGGSGHVTEKVEVLVQGAFFGGVVGFGAGAVEFVIGAVPGTFEGGDLALDAGEEFSGGRIGEKGGGE